MFKAAIVHTTFVLEYAMMLKFRRSDSMNFQREPFSMILEKESGQRRDAKSSMN
jgi:hypothetical protein